jgi:Rod binding domain-containing protein
MWNTVPKGELISGSSEEQTYKDMLNEALANSIAEGRGIGIKEVILKDINRLAKGT